MTTVITGSGDRLSVLDPRRRRLVHFDSAGVFVGDESFAEALTSTPPGGGCFFPGLMGVLGDGARVVRGWGCIQLAGNAGKRPTLMTLEVVRPERRDTIGEFNSTSVWERGSAEERPGGFTLIPFGGVMSWAIASNRIYISEGMDYEVWVFDERGDLTGVLREETPYLAITPVDRDIYLEERVAEERPHPDDVPFAERLGAYQRLIVSHEGELWAQWVDRPTDSGTSWTVFSPDGSMARRIVLPKVDVLAIRGGKIYGHVESALGIQTVVIFDVPGWDVR